MPAFPGAHSRTVRSVTPNGWRTPCSAGRGHPLRGASDASARLRGPDVRDLPMPRATPQHDRLLHREHQEETAMSQYTTPALEAELAYRRQRLEAAVRDRRRWLPRRLRPVR